MDNFWNTFSGQLPPIPQPIKRKVFVSYHHRNDQAWYNSFSQTFGTQFDLFHDTSLDRQIDSDNTQYIAQAIRDGHIKGSSVTIVLMGTDTWKRRWVDWEIHATLEDGHGLLGIVLPDPYHSKDMSGNIIVPGRFFSNHQSGYAPLIHWPANYQILKQWIDYAFQLSSSNRNLIINTAPKIQRSSS